MSSIQEAVVLDITKHRGPSRFNPVVQRSGQEREDATVNKEADIRRRQEREERRMLRIAEGGRSGGYNDRQMPPAARDTRAPTEADEAGFDDFGRRVGGRKKVGESTKSASDRAQAALERLRKRTGGRREGEAGGSASTGRQGSRSRSPFRNASQGA
mmetsp:Transcript_55678/g.125534  ORF Transcript_55678/g.125534 Transcript_55678/m.125534 type:complete len:157 (+) Transcript_55678:60-530(+)